MKYKAVCFDIDGTLYPPDRIDRMMFPIVFRHPRFCKRYNEMRQVYRKRQSGFEAGDTPYFTREPLREHEAAILAEADAQPGTKAFEKAKQHYVHRLNRHYYGPLVKNYRILSPSDGVVGLFRDLKALGLKIGLMTDWPTGNKPEILGVSRYCDKMLSCDDGGYLKPEPRAFMYLCKEMDCRPEEMLYVGDSYFKDVGGAAGYGMDAVLINCNDGGDYPLATKVCKDWSAFESWLRSQMEA